MHALTSRVYYLKARVKFVWSFSCFIFVTFFLVERTVNSVFIFVKEDTGKEFLSLDHRSFTKGPRYVSVYLLVSVFNVVVLYKKHYSAHGLQDKALSALNISARDN